jgi:hypothetical protein
MTCDQLLTSEQVAAVVPKITKADDFTPEKGSEAAKAVSYAGVACGYTNPSTGHTVALSVARPSEEDLTALKNKATTSSNVVPTYGVPPKVMGYFNVEPSGGVAQAFSGSYWIVAESKDYLEPGDAGQVITGVLSNLPG